MRKYRDELQEVDIMRRWIYRAFARELQRWLMAYAPYRTPLNPASYAQVLAICRNTLDRFTNPLYTVEIIEPDAEARARRMGPTVVLRWRGRPV